MPIRPPGPFPLLLSGAPALTLAAADEPTTTPTAAPGADQSQQSVAPPTPGPGYTRAPGPAA